MAKASRDFQVFAKPIGSACNLDCQYCYYLNKKALYPEGEMSRMPDDVLETYIVQIIAACTEPVINFSWHGGEPTLLGLDYFRRIVSLQQKHQPTGRRITNSIQTNGTLLDEDWCRFFAKQRFAMGLSIDGPPELHDNYRRTKNQEPTHKQVMRAYHLLRQHNVLCDILCVVHAENVLYPTRIYRFFKQIKAEYLGFLPLVEKRLDTKTGVSHRSVPAKALGIFLSTIFDEWKQQDIGRVKIQMFEEMARTAFGQEHSLCIFRETCGDIPVVEHNGDFFSCDHFVNEKHCLGNIREVPLVELLESPEQRAFGQAKLDKLTRYCRACEVREMCHGGCPKDRFILTPDGEPGLSYLCAGYKHFFTHCRPFVAELSNLWRRQSRERQAPPEPSRTAVSSSPKTGRNAPCPCGSGLKYKKCCLSK